MNKEDAILISRVADLERRMAMFEGMFHALSGRLDQHFKKYDIVMNSQQQQIIELNSVISTLLNDQFRHAEMIKEKLSTTIHGISSMDTNSIHQTDTSDIFSNGGRPYDGNSNIPADVLFDDIISNNKNGTTNAPVSAQTTENAIKNQGFAHQETQGTTQQEGEQPRAPQNQQQPHQGYQPSVVFRGPVLSYGNFNQLSHPSLSRPPNLLNEPEGNISESSPSISSEVIFNNSSNNNGIGNNNGNNGKNELLTARHEISNQSLEEEEQYRTKKGHKKKRKIYIGPFEFLKSPNSVLDLWKEYTEGIHGHPSIKYMDAIYQTNWRRDAAVNRRYSRRKVLWKAIESGLEKGYSLERVVDILENCRIIDSTKGTKQPIGWLCHSNNIPDILKDSLN
ncbi:Msn1p NDAI_0G04020 [Naumovozyma dairenensis CBS 421]|uniref:Transcription activator GCR1-like domain-containing protein n=1 Tax=Naumovozyma dairenensis (strain ATCC 10597 / BCRC 20456 / CBS 421 / NBRC 0211 / NRRL Y-12639) TaxID=1071378 RepID=G0WEG8_NAUDC|nr:hypothetical protein NDAI_0G04020 [Naumovozyma dairenensis CBS 421]CCD26179.2 hypothetical protein NDAI_0G04020 [Naumovozyma dairenensis CBS 421]